jgi:hypothetical protein
LREQTQTKRGSRTTTAGTRRHDYRDVGGENVIWLLVLVLLILAIGGGVAVSNFLFLLLIVALVLALVGAFNRSTV